MARTSAIPIGLIEATRLTRAGRLLEATALIQRTLQGDAAHAGAAEAQAWDRGSEAGADAIDVEFAEILEDRNPDSHAGERAAADHIPPRFDLRSTEGSNPGAHAAEQFPRPGPVHDAAPGQFVSGSFANQAGTRQYKLYVPTGFAGQSLPLVVMLHGCTQTADDFARGTRMNALAEEQQCLVLYPVQSQAANHSRCWNWFKRGDQRRDQGEPAILAGMTREVMNRYAVAADRVYVAGLSAGGAMAAVMGAAYPELFAAVGIHSGLACGSAHDLGSALAAMRGRPASMAGAKRGSPPPTPATPTIVFHGARDKTVHPRNGEHVVARSVEGSGASRADASTERGQVPGGHAYTRTVYRDPTGRAVLEHWLVHEGGHAWFGGSAGGSYVDPKGPDAAREMMRFFYDQALPGASQKR
jgi:poly(hydroxyalkanoate) depolymerase family esterase